MRLIPNANSNVINCLATYLKEVMCVKHYCAFCNHARNQLLYKRVIKLHLKNEHDGRLITIHIDSGLENKQRYNKAMLWFVFFSS